MNHELRIRPVRSISLPLILDVAERAVSTMFFGFFALRLLEAYLANGGPGYVLLLISEGLVVGFILMRRMAHNVSLRPSEWCIAIVGTLFPLLINPSGDQLVPSLLANALMLAGLAINIWAKLSLRRSFGVVAANRGIKTRGAYSLIRHPMYFGYVVTQVGFLLSNFTSWNLMVYGAALLLQILRIKAEERVLAQDPLYTSYAERVRYRLFPGVF
jgi:protein-S-isoprenylcysteine O-methyltransferase Ste14